MARQHHPGGGHPAPPARGLASYGVARGVPLPALRAQGVRGRGADAGPLHRGGGRSTNPSAVDWPPKVVEGTRVLCGDGRLRNAARFGPRTILGSVIGLNVATTVDLLSPVIVPFRKPVIVSRGGLAATFRPSTV